jgi:hypothetical protein
MNIIENIHNIIKVRMFVMVIMYQIRDFVSEININGKFHNIVRIHLYYN